MERSSPSDPDVANTFAQLQAALADRYALERELGHGGMATVFLARDLCHGRLVAIKVLRPERKALPIVVAALLLLVIGGWGLVRRLREHAAEQRLDELARLPADMLLDSLRQAVPWLLCRPAGAGARFDHTCSWEAGGLSALAATLDGRLAQIGVVWVGSGRPHLDLDAWARARYGMPAGSTICNTRREDSVSGAVPAAVLGVAISVRRTVTWWTHPNETIVVRHGRGPWGALHLGSHRLHWVPGCDENEGLDIFESKRPHPR